jgi:hypothetical protein
MDALVSLKAALANANSAALTRTPFSVDLESTIRFLKTKVNSTSGSTEPRDRVLEAVNLFFIDPKVDNLQIARLISFGLTLKINSPNQSLLDDLNKFEYFLSDENGIGQWKSKPAWFRRIVQGLVASYFSFDPESSLSTNTQRKNWNTLRNYIASNLSHAEGGTNPDWLNCCLEHPSLFSESPGDDFIDQVLKGETEKLEENFELLRAKESWLPRELILSQIKKITSFDDARFLSYVSPMLSAIVPHRTFQNKALALLVNRYAETQNAPIHSDLKEITVSKWDNPWLTGSQKKWPTEVTEEGRALIADWLKSEFIEAFFTKMAEDGNTDRRRLDFWMKYRKHMNHVHFALGSAIIESTDPDLIFLKNKMKGLISSIKNRKHDSAFIMYMGDVIAVEFSQNGNALYLYDASNSAPFDLTRPLELAKDGRNSLKNTSGISFRHQDGVNGFAKWEAACFSFMARKFGIHPDKALDKNRKLFLSAESNFIHTPAKPVEEVSSTYGPETNNSSARDDYQIPVFTVPKRPAPPITNVVFGKTSWAELYNQPYSDQLLASTCSAFRFEIQDNRSHGGALWVNTNNGNSERNRVFTNWGFKYKATKGWWKN